jgi:hypothetical protein
MEDKVICNSCGNYCNRETASIKLINRGTQKRCTCAACQQLIKSRIFKSKAGRKPDPRRSNDDYSIAYEEAEDFDYLRQIGMQRYED